MITTTSATSGQPASTNQLPSSGLNLKPEDFIKMMVTQLQQQDPTQPASNDQLLAQMSQIGQLQSATDLQTSLKGMVLQNQIGSASQLIGKTVQGLDVNNNTITGMVNSIQVKDTGVSLELDNGTSLDMAKVTSIAQSPNSATTTQH